MQNDQSEKPSGINPLVWVLVALAVLVLALGAGIVFMLSARPASQTASTLAVTATSTPGSTLLPPTETPAPATQAPAATSLPPSPTPFTGDPAVVLGRPSGLDTFDTANNWTLYDNACFKSEITSGVFVMSAKGLAQASCWEVSWPVVQNYYVETLVQMPAACQAEDRFGLFFRSPDNLSGYLFGLTCDGRFSMNAWDGQTTTVLVEPTANASILTGPGQSNRLGVVASGGTYALYANGALLQVLQDYTFAGAGRLGYYVRAATETGFAVQYDNLGVLAVGAARAWFYQWRAGIIDRNQPRNHPWIGRDNRARRHAGCGNLPIVYATIGPDTAAGLHTYSHAGLHRRSAGYSLGYVQPAGCQWE